MALMGTGVTEKSQVTLHKKKTNLDVENTSNTPFVDHFRETMGFPHLCQFTPGIVVFHCAQTGSLGGMWCIRAFLSHDFNHIFECNFHG